MERDQLNPQQLKCLLDQIVQQVQDPAKENESFNPDVLAVVLKNIGFFHKNIAHPANIHDFIELAKHQLHYEVHPSGTVLHKETDYPNRLCIVVKGCALRLQQRPYNELEREVRKKNPEIFKEAIAAETERKLPQKQEDKNKVNPRYQQHTKSTMKKVGFARFLNPRHQGQVTIESGPLTTEENKMATIEDIENGSDTSLDKDSKKSLDEEEWDQYLMAQEYSLEGETSPSAKTSKLKRLNTIKGNILQKKGISFKSVHDSQGSVDDEDSDELDDETKKRKEKKRKEKPDDLRMNENDITFLKQVSENYPELKGRFFLADIIRLQKVRTYRPGDYFGENFYRENLPRENSISVVTSPELHLITITKESYDEIMEDIWKQAKAKADFFVDLFPSFDAEVIKNFSYHFSEKHFAKNEIIYNQNDRANELYLIIKGSVRLVKEVSAPSNNGGGSVSKRAEKMELPIVTIPRHQFFGEELLLKEGRRLYTGIAAATGVSVYFINIQEYSAIKGTFENFLKVLKQQAQKRFDWRQERAMNLLEQKTQKTNQTPLQTMILLEKSKSNSEPAVNLLEGALLHKSSSAKRIPIASRRELSHDEAENVKKARSPVPQNPINEKYSEIYKAKFSRKPKHDEEKKGWRKGEEESLLLKNPHHFLDFNIARELDRKPFKLKLPLIHSPKNPSIGKEVPHTTRALATKTNTDQTVEYVNHDQSTILVGPTTNLMDSFEGDGPTLHNVEKKRLRKMIYPNEKNIPSGVSNLIKRIEDNYFSPKGLTTEESKREKLVNWEAAIHGFKGSKTPKNHRATKSYRLLKGGVQEVVKSHAIAKTRELSPIVGVKRELFKKDKKSEGGLHIFV